VKRECRLMSMQLEVLVFSPSEINRMRLDRDAIGSPRTSASDIHKTIHTSI